MRQACGKPYCQARAVELAPTVASPSFTPTTPMASPVGRVVPYWGYETSFGPQRRREADFDRRGNRQPPWHLGGHCDDTSGGCAQADAVTPTGLVPVIGAFRCVPPMDP